MGTITASTILSRVGVIIQDTTGARWPEAELLNWLNDGQREIVLLKPDSYAQNTTMLLLAGTKQTIPSAGVSLVDVIRNMGTNGTTAGRAIRIIRRKVLDEQRPEWHTETAAAVTKHYVFDDRDPKRFYVYPPSDGTNYVELLYSSAPHDVGASVTDTWTLNHAYSTLGAQITATVSAVDYIFEVVKTGTSAGSAPTFPATFGVCVSDGTVVWQNKGAGTITLDDIYANALIDYVLYRAYQKDADYTANDARVAAAYSSFKTSLGLLDQREMMDNPQHRTIPGQTGGNQ